MKTRLYRYSCCVLVAMYAVGCCASRNDQPLAQFERRHPDQRGEYASMRPTTMTAAELIDRLDQVTLDGIIEILSERYGDDPKLKAYTATWVRREQGRNDFRSYFFEDIREATESGAVVCEYERRHDKVIERGILTIRNGEVLKRWPFGEEWPSGAWYGIRLIHRSEQPLAQFQRKHPGQRDEYAYMRPTSMAAAEAIFAQDERTLDGIIKTLSKHFGDDPKLNAYTAKLVKLQKAHNDFRNWFFSDIGAAMDHGAVACEYEWNHGETRETGILTIKNGDVLKRYPSLEESLSARHTLHPAHPPTTSPHADDQAGRDSIPDRD